MENHDLFFIGLTKEIIRLVIPVGIPAFAIGFDQVVQLYVGLLDLLQNLFK